MSVHHVPVPEFQCNGTLKEVTSLVHQSTVGGGKCATINLIACLLAVGFAFPLSVMAPVDSRQCVIASLKGTCHALLSDGNCHGWYQKFMVSGVVVFMLFDSSCTTCQEN